MCALSVVPSSQVLPQSPLAPLSVLDGSQRKSLKKFNPQSYFELVGITNECRKSLNTKKYNEIDVNCVLEIGAAITVGTIAGSCIGAIAGYTTTNIPGVKPGAILGAKIGSVVGASLGIGYSVFSYPIKFYESTSFRDWKINNHIEELYPIYRQIIQNDLCDYACPITQDFIEYPVRTPGGFVYERAALIEWMLRHKRGMDQAKANGATPQQLKDMEETQSPHREKYFKVEDLVPDYDYYDRLHNAMLVNCKDRDESVRKMLENVLNQLKKNKKETEQNFSIALHQAGIKACRDLGIDSEDAPRIVRNFVFQGTNGGLVRSP